MGQDTKIEWANHTFNPWWGCIEVSPACDHCYAKTFAKRVGHDVWGKESPRRFFGDKHWAEPLKWQRAAEKAGVRERVFCASMADVMEDRPDLAEHRARLFGLIRETPALDWLLLTKRPQNFCKMLPASWLESPLPNVWGMTTVESTAQLWRVQELRKTPFAVRGLSCEPLLGPLKRLDLAGIRWVITGGESGPGARPMHPDWARSLRDQCVAAGAAFHFKQWGEWVPTDQTRFEDGVEHRLFPDGTLMPWADFELGPWGDDDAEEVVKIGKKYSGRLLDGREWSELPKEITNATN